MATLASYEQDVLFTANHMPHGALDSLADVTPSQEQTRLQEMSPHLHRQAAHHRNGRLRKIEALRRSGK